MLGNHFKIILHVFNVIDGLTISYLGAYLNMFHSALLEQQMLALL